MHGRTVALSCISSVCMCIVDAYRMQAMPNNAPNATAPSIHARMHAGIKAGALYHFDPELTPQQVFSRFFGTANPYEALDGEPAFLVAGCT